MVIKIPDRTQGECVYECNTLETVSKRSAGVTEGRKHREKSSETLTATRVQKAVLKAVSSRQGRLVREEVISLATFTARLYRI